MPAATYAVDTILTPSWSDGDYDGKAFTSDQTDLTDLPTIHALYVHPADKPSRFSDFAAMFQADARAASKFLSDLYGRGARFDERTGSDGRSTWTSPSFGASTPPAGWEGTSSSPW